MVEDRDRNLGQIALEKGLVTSEQLERCLAELEVRRSKGQAARLEQILVLHKLVDNLGLLQLIREASWRLNRNSLTERYRIERRLGEGGMAVVYLARDTKTGREVALKLLKGLSETGETGRKRLEREAKLMASFDHPNVARVFDVGEAEGRTYLTMEVVNGTSLREALKARSLDRRTLLGVLAKVSRAVHHAHEKGIVHRDLKPSNVMLASGGEPKVLDFGLARNVDSKTILTDTGTKLGTPLYMAPEQVVGKREGITPQTDVHALGAMLYEVLTGNPPYTGMSAADVYRNILDATPAPPHEIDPSIPRSLGKVALQALEKDPSRRQDSAATLADQLAPFL